MRRPPYVIALLPVAALVALLFSATPRAPEEESHESPAAAEALARDRDIALFERRAAQDPWSAADRGRLAALYLQRAREHGSHADFQRAESLAVAALRLREAHNDEVLFVLAAARLALHDFTKALTAARALVARDSTAPDRRAVLGEVLLELGEYDEAAAVFRSLESRTERTGVAARLARWYELTGRLTHARNVMRYALRRAVEDSRATREQVAWFHLRLGEIELKRGAVERAESLFVDGLREFPEDHRLLGALATAAARRQDWPAAIDAGERAIARQLDPAVLGVLSEAYAALGDWAQSVSHARAMRATALAQPGPIHRVWGLFLLDHGDDAAAVLARARHELETRRDVYGYDLAAWALHRLHRDAEAWRFMERALRQGTEDALLWYHAAEISKARGDMNAAVRFASRAVALDPRFHPEHGAKAREITRWRPEAEARRTAGSAELAAGVGR